MSRTAWRLARIALGAVVFVPASCGRDVVIGENHASLGDAAAGGATSSAGGAAGTVADSATTCRQAQCQNHLYECGDCIDNDGDGLVDMDDPDCLGPCHNSETSFFGNIPGQNNNGNCVQDCYFDQDSGGGNDDCVWSHHCDPLSIAPDYPPEGQSCAYDPSTKVPGQGTRNCATLTTTQSPQCASVCGPLVPNGCDCFGCCKVTRFDTPVWMGSTDAAGNGTCDLGHVSDPTKCKPCTQVAGCLNPCDACELCVGKRDLPAECADGGGCAKPACPLDLTPCGTPCLPPCPDGDICITGCCERLPH